MKNTRFKFRGSLMASAALLCAALTSAASAQVQQQPAPQEDSSATDTDVAEIVVTATKREERILDIPQSVSVVSGDTLERQQATTFQDYLNQVPGLSLEQSEPGEGRLMLRGVNTGGVASTVAVYIDETPFGSSSGLVNGAVLAADFDPFDVARIEVLRGPQGTLYGASSLGGVLKFVTNTPKLGKFSARARAGIEFVDDGGTGYNINGVVNAPLGETVAFRGTGFYRKRAGWVDAGGTGITLTSPFGPTLLVASQDDKDINESEIWGGRGSLLFQPTDLLSIRLTAIAQKIESDGSSDVEVDPDDLDPIDGFQRSIVFDEPSEVKYRLYNGAVEYDFGFASLLSSTSFGRQDQSFTDDYTAIFGSALNVYFGPLNPNISGFSPQLTDEVIGMLNSQQTNLKKFTQEVRLASPSNEHLEWLVGAYYTKERGTIDQVFSGVSIDTGQTFTNPILGDLATALVESRFREIAGFANVTWHLNDRFDITAGGRLSQNKQSAEQTTAGSNPLLLPGGGAALPAIHSKEDVFTYSVSPRYEISDSTAVYARLAKGYRPGGPNVVPPAAGPNVPRSYDSDTITSYELGLKSDISRLLSFDLSFYHLDWKDIQLFTSVDNFGVNANGGSARSNGFEATLNARPMRGLNLSANAAVIDAKLKEDTPPLVGGFDGDRLPWVPRATFSLNGDYEWNIGGTNTAFVGATFAYTGKQKANFEAGEIVGLDPEGEFIFEFSPQRSVPTYTTLGLRAGADFGLFTVEAFARNVTNSRGITSLSSVTDEVTGASPLPGGALRASLLQPRTFGLSVQAKF